MGTGWARAQEATRLTQLPHFQYQAIKREKHQQVNSGDNAIVFWAPSWLDPPWFPFHPTLSSLGADTQTRSWNLQLQRLLNGAGSETTEQTGAAQLWGDTLQGTHWGKCSCLFCSTLCRKCCCLDSWRKRPSSNLSLP